MPASALPRAAERDAGRRRTRAVDRRLQGPRPRSAEQRLRPDLGRARRAPSRGWTRRRALRSAWPGTAAAERPGSGSCHPRRGRGCGRPDGPCSATSCRLEQPLRSQAGGNASERSIGLGGPCGADGKGLSMRLSARTMILGAIGLAVAGLPDRDDNAGHAGRGHGRRHENRASVTRLASRLIGSRPGPASERTGSSWSTRRSSRLDPVDKDGFQDVYWTDLRDPFHPVTRRVSTPEGGRHSRRRLRVLGDLRRRAVRGVLDGGRQPRRTVGHLRPGHVPPQPGECTPAPGGWRASCHLGRWSLRRLQHLAHRSEPNRGPWPASRVVGCS